MTENEIGTIIIETAIAVHRELVPGLLESVYEVVLAKEIEARGLHIKRQVPVSIAYKNMEFDEGFRADIIVEKRVILELKSVEKVSATHKKQIQTYLKLTGCKLGYVLNFNGVLMKDGIIRCVNGLSDQISASLRLCGKKNNSESGRRECLAPSPHTTRHVGPHLAVQKAPSVD